MWFLSLLVDVPCRSQHIVKGVLGIVSADSYALDMCSDGRCPHVYPTVLNHAGRRRRQGERCPNCGTNRYIKRNRQLLPARRCVLTRS